VAASRRRRLAAPLGLALLVAGVTGSAAPALAQGGGEDREATLPRIEAVAARGPVQPSWDSLAGYRLPDWYQDAQFGIFIHRGVYSVPAFGNEWYPREMYRDPGEERAGIARHHRESFGAPSEFGYKDFIPLFRAEHFDADAWLDLFQRAGARYIVPVAEHHDGFPMYDSRYTDWSAARMGPKRDVIGELAAAARRAGLVFGLSSHRVENWWFYGKGREIASDVTDDRYRGLYGPARDREESEAGRTPPDAAFLEDWLLRSAELVDAYQPQLIWFDWWIAQPPVHPYLKTLAAYYYNRGEEWQRGVAINYKKHGGESFPDTAGVLDIERGQLGEIRELFWQTDTSVSKTSWGYVENHEYKTVDSIVDDLVDIVSKNGCLLLNIGPRADGTIPEREQEMLLEIGKWLDVNGEAIYGTRPWVRFGEGPTEVAEGPFADTEREAFGAEDFRFTRKGETLYAVALGPVPGAELRIRSLPAGDARVEDVRLLGGAGPLEWEQDGEGLAFRLPAALPSRHAVTLALTGEGLVAGSGAPEAP
jgi:alpha-L-fucosidase